MGSKSPNFIIEIYFPFKNWIFVGCIKYVNIMSFEVIFVTPCYIRLFKICKICLPFQNWWKQAVKYKYQDIQDFSSKPKICATVKISIFDEFFTKIIILVKVIFFGVYCGLKYCFRYWLCKSNNAFSSSWCNALPLTV